MTVSNQNLHLTTILTFRINALCKFIVQIKKVSVRTSCIIKIALSTLEVETAVVMSAVFSRNDYRR